MIAAGTAFRHDGQFRRIEIHLRPRDASVLHLEGHFAGYIAERRHPDIFAGRQFRLEGGVIGTAGIVVGTPAGAVCLVKIPPHPVAVAERGAAIEQDRIGDDVILRGRLLRLR